MATSSSDTSYATQFVYDGYVSVLRCDTELSPSILSNTTCALAVNYSFRKRIPATRPPFSKIEVTFENKEDEEIFRHGNVQGAIPYNATITGTVTGIVVAIAGNIFFLQIGSGSLSCRRIWTGWDATQAEIYLLQAEDRVFAQNGKDNPLQWDGQQTTVFVALDPAAGEMPVGTHMAYCYGRIWLCNEANQIVAGDIVYGSGFTNTANLKNFTEATYWAEGGSFGFPASLGRITGIGVMQAIDTANGQGYVIVMGSGGIWGIDASVERAKWIETEMVRIILMGKGCIAAGSVVNVNNDLWFRSESGWCSMRLSASDFNQSPSFVDYTRSARRWISSETPHWRKYTQFAHFDSRLLGTTNIMVENAPSPYGNHRYGRGLLAIDLDLSIAQSAEEAYRMEGLWTGVRPTQLIRIVHQDNERLFVFSFDADKENRVYELGKTVASGHDAGCKRIRSKLHTKRFAWTDTELTNAFEPKVLAAEQIHISNMIGETELYVQHRPDNEQAWYEVSPAIKLGRDITIEGCDIIVPGLGYARVKLPGPSPQPCTAADRPSNTGTEFQLKLEIEGAHYIDRLRVATRKEMIEGMAGGDCRAPSTGNALDTCEGDFDYLIVDPTES